MMTRSPRPRNRTFDRLHIDLVSRDDGRYLLYYSWPDQPPAEGPAAPASEPARGAQQPWTPEGGPPVEDGEHHV